MAIVIAVRRVLARAVGLFGIEDEHSSTSNRHCPPGGKPVDRAARDRRQDGPTIRQNAAPTELG
jgi:hypothetical protein